MALFGKTSGLAFVVGGSALGGSGLDVGFVLRVVFFGWGMFSRHSLRFAPLDFFWCAVRGVFKVSSLRGFAALVFVSLRLAWVWFGEE